MKRLMGLFCLIILVSCTPVLDNQVTENIVEPILVEEPTGFDHVILEIINTKLQAIRNDDLDLYMSTVTNLDEYYYNEQGRWFKEMTKDEIKNLNLQVISTETIDEQTAVVYIHQTHDTREHFDFEYPLLFKKEEGIWKDHGYYFMIYETDRFIVKYMPDESRVEEFSEYLNNAYDTLDTIFDEKADKSFELKLFSDRELLRQRTVPSITWLFTGWAEPNESLKMYTGHQYDGYQGTMQHELVHHITIKICNNNLDAWLLEGMAMYYGNIYFEENVKGEIRAIDYSDMRKGIDYLESVDLYNTSGEEVRNWYNNSYLITRYIIETYDHDTVMALFYEAGKKPFNNSVTNDNYYMDNRITTHEVIETVLGMTTDELSDQYKLWLDENFE